MWNYIILSNLSGYPKPYQTGFQDAANPVMEGIINLHHHIMFFLVIVIFSTFYVLFNILSEFTFSNRSWIVKTLAIKKTLSLGQISHHAAVEFIWTILPTFILLLIVGPSFSLLYAMEGPIEHYLTLKVTGHQWYWSYEYSVPGLLDAVSGIKNATWGHESHMVETNELKAGQLRLLETTNPVILPTDANIKIVVTASDVLHAWAVPAFAIKIDAVPGRDNLVTLFIEKAGIYYGQCSELCGVKHGFMPIKILAIDFSQYSYVAIQMVNHFGGTIEGEPNLNFMEEEYLFMLTLIDSDKDFDNAVSYKNFAAWVESVFNKSYSEVKSSFIKNGQIKFNDELLADNVKNILNNHNDRILDKEQFAFFEKLALLKDSKKDFNSIVTDYIKVGLVGEDLEAWKNIKK